MKRVRMMPVGAGPLSRLRRSFMKPLRDLYPALAGWANFSPRLRRWGLATVARSSGADFPFLLRLCLRARLTSVAPPALLRLFLNFQRSRAGLTFHAAPAPGSR